MDISEFFEPLDLGYIPDSSGQPRLGDKITAFVTIR